METWDQVAYMRHALALATRARGRTSPNPMVGAVIVKADRIIGEGFHPRVGEPHAEIFALREAGSAAQGATMYVTLEPCCHFGRTPPCTRALIAAGIAEVHIAMLDPNPLVAGKGQAELDAAGIRTTVGLGANEAADLNEAFVKYITTRLPFVTAKFAMSLDGKIATRAGDARWISGAESRVRVHALRDASDALLVGVNTILADDPQLTTRLDSSTPERQSKDAHHPDVHHPLRIIVDSCGRIPLTTRVLDPALPSRTIIATTAQMPAATRHALESRGVEVWVLPEREKRVDLSALMRKLGEREITTVLAEGGGTLLASLFEQGLVDKVLAFVAPIVIGGDSAPTPVRGAGIAHLTDALRLDRVSVERIGADVLISGYVNKGSVLSESLP